MNDILKRAEELTAYAKAHLELDERDGFYVKNRLLEILQNCENEELSEEPSVTKPTLQTALR